jgi:hypothetical protein
MTKRFLVVCLLPLLLASAAACSKPDDGRGIPSVNGSAAPSATPSLSGLEQTLKFTQCMRAHGVPMPDPVINGDDIRNESYDKDPVDKETVDKAEEACKQYRPVPSADQIAQKTEKSREYSRCMRQHGVENYPDPGPDGGPPLDPSVRGDLQYDQADATCSAQVASPRPSS